MPRPIPPHAAPCRIPGDSVLWVIRDPYDAIIRIDCWPILGGYLTVWRDRAFLRRWHATKMPRLQDIKTGLTPHDVCVYLAGESYLTSPRGREIDYLIGHSNA